MTDFKTRAAGSLDAARRRTRALTDCLDDAELLAQHSPLMSPLVWDLAHVGNVEEVHLVRRLGHRPAIRPDLDEVYDAFEHPRAERPALPLLSPTEARDYIDTVRAQAFDVLDSLEGDAEERRTVLFLAQHEHQHGETMLATHQLREGEAVLTAPRPQASAPPGPPVEVLVEHGAFMMGAATDEWALDNERPAHVVDIPAFWIDTSPVTAAEYGRFIDDGGYEDQRWWTAEGRKHRTEARLEAPLFWRKEGGLWARRRFGRTEPVPGDQPVMHVSWYEADAYARWAGRRLPTEAEWEKAARWDRSAGLTRRNPWGEEDADTDHAGLGRHLEPAPSGSFPAGESPCGARQMIGDVWEWTSSDFDGYPGFRPYPGPDYSEVFFDGRYKVLRGGSFGTHPDNARATFRNWDFPVRRQIFAGFRTARDAG
ncbi:ergothioneine biosynthesis protein EgtB [Glycomyces sp. L485]|uniref:ergothioneine biosynthesis protein EgtB n=1 Tax=Glycomyces sp. L485 TaxID=2909235 RepID=UPI001F4A5CA7|nr:ergothioneine biosynthesis protein EgtB [Glycomyces sp. L485]MCH7232128.1 ergothioneine biosynthesis protein EgtB [Glycomyces sp. L485]